MSRISHSLTSFKVVFASGFLFFGLVAQTNSQEPLSWTDRFRHEAPIKWEEYRSFAQRLQGAIEWDEFSIKGGDREKQIDSHRLELKQSGTSALGVDINRGYFRVKPAARVVNSKYAFELRKEEGGWVIADLYLNLDQIKSIDTLHPQKRKESVHGAASVLLNVCNVGQIRLLHQVTNDREFVLKGVVPIQQEGREFARVSFSNLPEHPTQYRWGIDGWVLLDPDHYWVVKEAELSIQHPNNTTGLIIVNNHYKITGAGFPMPTESKIRRKYFWTDGDQQKSREAEGIRRFEFVEKDKVAEHEFSLSAFGLPEPKGHEIPQPSRWWLWFGLMAIASLCIGAYFRRRVRQRNQVSPT